MKKLKHLILAMCLSAGTALMAQTGNKPITADDLVAWQRITQQEIANNGEWTACRMEPWKGDATVFLYNKKGQLSASFATAGEFQFSSSSSYLVVSRKPALALVEALKVKKTKVNEMPMNSLTIHTLHGESQQLDSIRTYSMATQTDWLAYQQGRKDSTLYICSLDGTKTYTRPSVTNYGFARDKGMIYYLSGNKSGQKLWLLNLATGATTAIKEGKGKFSQITFDRSGNQLAFLYADNEKTAYKNTQLWLSSNAEQAHNVIPAHSTSMPADWVVSAHSRLAFSHSGNRLFFGTSPVPRQKDTLVLAENRPYVQVWSWDEPVQYTVQQHNKEEDLKKNYSAVYSLQNKTIHQIGTLAQPDTEISYNGEGEYALAYTSTPYSLSWMWEGRTRSDFYAVSLKDGSRKEISHADYSEYSLSPEGRYAYCYAATDSCWYTISLADGTKHRLTTPQTFTAWDEDNDVPDYPQAYGCAGWAIEDKYIYIYDRYDIWQFDPQGKQQPINLTIDGRKKNTSYRLIQLDKEKRSIEPRQPQLLLSTNHITKGNGYYSARLHKPAVPRRLMEGDYMLASIVKSRDTNKLIFTKETYQTYPDIHYTDLSFRHPVRLTEGYRQQEDFTWGTAELVSWTSLDGTPLEGVVYKPANFDPSKKYPLIVNFYERNSDRLYKYRIPEAHRSTIDYHMYNSNGYIVFNPDVRYRDGHPGESCYNCVIPGVQMLVSEGYIDEKAIGAQGHSWGGYQTAYLVTRTNMFAAIESGAPVVNMFSAYGGIRWGSGLARSFQYEHTQSRLGTTPWEGPEIYTENSPLFTMDKVNTPVLIMHNDNDGHVPWYQGIEYFVAMKRLNKPCWLLNYSTEIHWPLRLANKKDFQIRMQQFFDHYLKKAEMPKWMKDGVPAVNEPFELGY